MEAIMDYTSIAIGFFWKRMKPSNKASSSLIIREFRIEDYDDLIALWNAAKLPYRPRGRDRRDRIEHEIRQGDSIFLVAEIDGELIGSVIATHDGRKGWINRLAVDARCQHQNIGKSLVIKAESRLSQLGIEILACLIEVDNITSLQLFEKLGYERHSDIAYFSKRKNSDV